MDGAKVIWILFGDIRGAETRRPMLESIYRKHQAAAEAKGYTIGFSQPQGTSTKAFIHLIKDRSRTCSSGTVTVPAAAESGRQTNRSIQLRSACLVLMSTKFSSGAVRRGAT